MKPSALPLCLSLLTASLFLSVGCSIIPEPQDDPTRYYSLALPANATAAVPGDAAGLRLGLRPIEMPAYLKKNVMAVRQGNHEISYDEFARWAEPFEAGMARLLRESVESSQGVARVDCFPFPLDKARDLDVRIRLRNAEGLREEGTGRIVLNALIEIEQTSDGATIRSKAFQSSPIPWDGKDKAALAHGLSAAIQEMAAEIVSLVQKQK